MSTPYEQAVERAAAMAAVIARWETSCAAWRERTGSNR